MTRWTCYLYNIDYSHEREELAFMPGLLLRNKWEVNMYIPRLEAKILRHV